MTTRSTHRDPRMPFAGAIVTLAGSLGFVGTVVVEEGAERVADREYAL
jgi:hypothetical protein